MALSAEMNGISTSSSTTSSTSSSTTTTTAATSNASSCDAVPEVSAALPAALMFAVGVLGNALAVTVLACSRRDSKQTVFYALVCALTVTDLLSTCLSSPLVLAAYGAQKTIEQLGGNPLCVYFTFCMLFFGFATMGILCTMAVERWLSLAHPYVYQRRVSQTWVRVALALVLVVSAALSALPLAAGVVRARMYRPCTWCYVDARLERAYGFVYAAATSLLIGAVVACNVGAGVALFRMRRRLTLRDAVPNSRRVSARVSAPLAALPPPLAPPPPLPPPSSSSQPGRESPLASLRRKISVQRLQRIHRPRGVEVDNLVLLVFMTIIFLVCSLPLTVSTLINAIWPTNTDFKRDLAGLRFASFNPILDPWIFIIVRRSVLERLLSVPARLRAALLPHRASGDSRGSGLLRHLGKGKGGGGGSSESASLSSFQLAQLIRSADASPMMAGRLAEILGRGGEPGALDSVRSSLDLELPDGKFSELLLLSRSRREAET
uniref:Prostacyclin receptor-like n=1 Tax=Petromyzon marinus TaxID=7757 RepID=A0AAJ7TMS1_PETMA|nr:prostacyclin receptor-like [Petromyzon marinus]